jgi:DNA polymerase-3 subunit beta
MMRTTMDIDVLSMPDKEDDRKFCIHNTVICDFLKNIPSQPITFDVDMENSEAKISYMNGHIQFPCTSGNDYPSICFMKDEHESVSLPSGTILEDITRTSPFTGQDTLRPVMNAICFYFLNEGLDVVSSNGGVLVKITHTDIRTEKEAKFLLPPKPVTMLKYFLSKERKDVSIRFTDNAAVFECDNWQLTCRLVEGRYPNYNSVIPQNSNIEVTVDKKQLQESIRRMLPMGNQSMKTVKFETAGTVLTVSSEDVDFNKSAKEDIPCETAGNEIRIGVNGETLNCILTHIASDIVRLKMTEPSRAILVVPDEDRENETFLGLLMPCLLN